MIRGSVVTMMSVVMVCTLSAPAMAQDAPQTPAPAGAAAAGVQTNDPKHSITIGGNFGYLFAHTTKDVKANLPRGWAGSIDVMFDNRLAGILEFSSARQTGTAAQAPGARRLDGIMYGPRLIFPEHGRFTPFVQFLFGQTRTVDAGDRHFTLQPGVGADINVMNHVAVRVIGGYSWVRQPVNRVEAFRLSFGVVIR
jgi:hypothetical protein